MFKAIDKKDIDDKENSNLILEQEIESLLFYKGEEVSLAVLKKTLEKKESDIKEALKNLKERLSTTSSLVLLENEDKYLLTVNPKYSELINKVKNEEQFGELSPSALETLAIVLYKGPISKIELDEIRGVNSSYILRNLLIRGLVERKNINGKMVYTKTLDLMRYLGITNQEELPAFAEVLEKLDQIDKDDGENLDIKKEENEQ